MGTNTNTNTQLVLRSHARKSRGAQSVNEQNVSAGSERRASAGGNGAPSLPACTCIACPSHPSDIDIVRQEKSRRSETSCEHVRLVVPFGRYRCQLSNWSE